MRTEGRNRIPVILWFFLRAHWVSGLLPLAFLTGVSRLALAFAATAFVTGTILNWKNFPRGRLAKPSDDAFLALPPGSDTIRELVRQVTSPAASERERAELARRFFLSGFRYTLTDIATSVEEFLFLKKAGFYEHYAAGLALLLRGAGIPARIAAGYLGGEWSDPGKYLVVRQSDAHAWTEAWIEGRWVTLDATPSQGEGSPFLARTGTLGLYFD